MSRPFQPSTRAGFWRLWQAVCQRRGWAMNDDNRRALYRRALAYFKHQSEFGDKEWDLVFAEMRRNLQGLIAEGPESLAGVAEAGESRRLILAIETLAPEAYIVKIATDKFGAFADWRNLPPVQLDQLRITLIERRRAKQRKARREAAAVDFDRRDEPPAPPDREKLASLPSGEITDSYYET